MSKKITISLFFLLFAIFSSIAQQKKSFYLVGKNQSSLTPASITTKSDGSLNVTFQNEVLNNFMRNKKIIKYERAFPGISHPYLQKVYSITIENIENVNELTVFNSLIDKYEQFYEGQLASHPNDYMIHPPTRLERNNYLELIRAPLAWSITKGDPNILIGVADSYFTYSHEDLSNKLVDIIGPNNHPDLGHGTSVAYLAAGDTDNGKGGASIGYKTRMVGYGNGLTANDVYQLSQYPGVKVINMSWASSWYSSVEDTLYKHIHEDLNILLVAASGNQQCGGQFNYCYPASYDSVLSVTGVGSRFNRGITDPLWGVYGWEDIPEVVIGDTSSTMTINDKVDISAPAYGLYKALNSTLQGDVTGYNDWGEGTSGAAPLVSGAGALVFAANPTLSASQVKQILKETADNIYTIPHNQPYIGKLGTGRLNAFRAVMTAKCLDSINGSLDLMVRDNYDDYGQEPNVSTNEHWESVDMWVRNQNDGKDIRTNENPKYSGPGSKAFIYVRVTNKSCVVSTGDEDLELYWAKASTTLDWPVSWNGNLILNGKEMGNQVGTIKIPSLEPGEDTIIEFEWDIPNPDDYNFLNNEPWHYCLLSRINTVNDPMTVAETTNTPENVKNNNNIGWKNISVIKVNAELIGADIAQSAVISVGNLVPHKRKMRLNIWEKRKASDVPLFQQAELKIKLSPELTAYIKPTTIFNNLQYNEYDNTYLVKDDDSFIENLELDGNVIGTVTLSVNFLASNVTDKNDFDVKIAQYFDGNRLLGGETFLISKDYNNDIESHIYTETSGNNIILKSSNIYPNTIYNWYDSQNQLLYSGSDFTINSSVSALYKLEVLSLEDGFKDYSEITVSGNSNNTLNIYPNPTNSILNIDYDLQDGSGYLNITKIDNSVSNNYILSNSNTTTSIDVSNYSNGYYNIAIIKNGNVEKSAIFLKN